MRRGLFLLLTAVLIFSDGILVTGETAASRQIAGAMPDPGARVRVISSKYDARQKKDGAGGEILQFKGGGHIIGFAPEKVYMVSTGHALNVEFVGGGAKPLAAGGADHSREAVALNRIEYRNAASGRPEVHL